MKRLSTLLITSSLAAPLLAANAADRAPQLSPIDAGTVLNQINSQHPFPPATPVTLDSPFGAHAASLARPLMMAQIQANTLKIISLMLTGLEAQNSPHKAPAAYSQGVEYAAYDIAEALQNIDAAIKRKDLVMLRAEALRMEPLIEKLDSLARSVENEPGYSYWAGKEVKMIAAGLSRDIMEIRTNAPFAFSF